MKSAAVYIYTVQIRYPKITTTVAENLEITILSGENRVFLLSWLLIEKSPEIAIKLQNLKGADLKAKLLQCYSEIGICTDMNLLLGNCTLQEQLPTLELLLDFIKCMYIKSSNIGDGRKEFNNDILQGCTNINSDLIVSDIEPQLSYSESLEYFNNLKEYVADHQELNSNDEFEKKECTKSHEVQITEEKKDNENDKDLLFNTEKEKFLEAFSTIESWPMFKEKNGKNQKNIVYSMDSDIKHICSNFSSLTKLLQAKHEIFHATLPDKSNKIISPLTEVIECTLISTEEALNKYVDNY
ncbi:uncharacterized protein LOC143153620 isoform X2 [Ptiloglossa arizonensis]|uniref:uncharacterized protein LOC143153620 isoform X2 n=1 Tax=Ptiloglossa arizonensis TaxID=3350558 RepID=UPI003FA04C4D